MQASTPAVAQPSAPARSPCSVSSSAIKSQCRGDRAAESVSSRTSESASLRRPSANSALASGTRGSSSVGPASAIAWRNSPTAVSGSSARSHWSPARTCASAREMLLGVASSASLLIRTAARLWFPVRAASTSMASNISPESTTTSETLPIDAADNRRIPGVLPASALKRVPEAATQRVPDLVVQQEVDRQRGALQQPGLKVRWHPRLAREHRFQPQRRGVPGHRATELLAFLVGGLDGFGERDPSDGLADGLVARRGRWGRHRPPGAVGG